MGSDATAQSISWNAQLLRLTVFFGPAAQFDPGDWWAAVTRGGPSDEKVVKPRLGQYREEGVFGGQKLTLAVQPARIDWIYTVREDAPDEDKIATMGLVAPLLGTFLSIANQWFQVPDCPSAQRIAFGGTLLSDVPDRTTGYQSLSRYLGCLRIDPQNSTDLLYQINRPRDSRTGIPNLRINRLSKWSVARRVQQPLLVTAEGLKPAAVVGYSPEGGPFAVRVEVDINTPPNYADEFKRDQFPTVFTELVESGHEIAERGDIP